MGVARDTYPRDGGSFSFVAGFAEVEVDTETGQYHIVDYTAIGDSGTIIHPKANGGQLLGRSVLGMGHALARKPSTTSTTACRWRRGPSRKSPR
jgi:CO/xanthine dehydrogenase Mo-binding subunit